MKNFLFPILAFILFACSPQMTVTSEVTVTLLPPTSTSIPTPTLHPEFVALQNLLTDSSARFTLLPDGTIEEVTLDGTKQIIPNLHVDQNGVINLIINNEHIVIKPSQITFDDEEGIKIKGYELNDDEWAETAPSFEDILTQAMEDWNLNPENFTIKYDVDGKIVLQTNETLEIVYWDGYWSLPIMREMIVESGDCKATRWVGTEGQSLPPTVDNESFRKNFLEPLIELVRAELQKMTYPHVAYQKDFLGGANNCWAVMPSQRIGQPVNLLETTIIFWKDANGRLRHEAVFSPKVKKITLPQ